MNKSSSSSDGGGGGGGKISWLNVCDYYSCMSSYADGHFLFVLVMFCQ